MSGQVSSFTEVPEDAILLVLRYARVEDVLMVETVGNSSFHAHPYVHLNNPTFQDLQVPPGRGGEQTPLAATPQVSRLRSRTGHPTAR